MMRVYMILTLALLLAPFASAVPDIASQTIDSTVSGADTATMDGTNTATVSSNDAVLSQSVSQIADATAATQTATNEVPDSTGDGVALGQSIVQASIGDTSDQRATNNVPSASGDDVSLAQSIAQTAASSGDSKQDATNTATVNGENTALGQAISQGASGKNTDQSGSNIAFTGVYNLGDQGAAISQYIAQSGVADTLATQRTYNFAATQGDDVYVAQAASVAATGEDVDQITQNLALLLSGDDPVVVQYSAAGAVADDLAKQSQFNTAIYGPFSNGGSLSHLTLASAVADEVQQIQRNLIVP